MSWDWQVFCQDTIEREVVQGCFGKGGDITYGYAEQAVENFRANLDDAVFWTFIPLARPIWAVRGALRPDFRPYGRTCPNR